MKFFFFLLAFVLFLALLWRLFSRRKDLPCPSFLSWLVELDNPFCKTNRAGFIIEHLSLHPNMNVLDVGCGPGRLSIPIAKKLFSSGKLTVLDIQEAMLKKVELKAKASKLNNILYLHAKIGEAQLKKEYYDRALLITVLGEIPKQKQALEEIFSSLKKGGVLAITEIIFDPHFQRKSFVLQLAQSVGFQEKATYGGFLAFTMLLEKPC